MLSAGNFTDEVGSVALVIPTYNRADLIAETIEAALAQSQPFSKIIVVDDGSTDNTAQVLSVYAGKIQIITTANQGVQAARNLGVLSAETEFVTLCDSDDLLEPDYVKVASGWMRQHCETDILYCNFTVFDQNGTQCDKFAAAPEHYFLGSVQSGDFYCAIPDLYVRTLTFQPFFSTGVTFRRDFYKRVGGFDVRFKGVGAEDWEFSLRAISVGNAVACKVPLSRVRKHAGNDSGDAIRMNLGEAVILEFGLKHHAGAAVYSTEILQSVDARRVRAFDGAFARGDFELAGSTLRLLREPPNSLKFRLKRFICWLKPGLRQKAWRLSQNF